MVQQGVFDSPQARETGAFKDFPYDSDFTFGDFAKTCQKEQVAYDKQLEALYKLRNLERSLGIRTVVGPLAVQEESIFEYFKRECLPSFSRGLATLERFFCCSGLKQDLDYRQSQVRFAESAIDGLDRYYQHHATDFLELAPNVSIPNLKVVGDEGRDEDWLLGPDTRHLQPKVEKGVVTDEPTIVVGHNGDDTVGFVRIKVPVVETNFVIKKGKRKFYCNSLLKSIRTILGNDLPCTELSRKIIRRQANKMCDTHGLRPGDRQVAVEVVVRLYWYRNKLDRYIDEMVVEYEEARLGPIKRLYRRMRRYFGGKDGSLYIQ